MSLEALRSLEFPPLSFYLTLPAPVMLLGSYLLWNTLKNLTLDYVFPKDLKGSVVVITGAGSGIGRGLAIKLAGMGCQVALWDVNEKGMEETLRCIRENGGVGIGYTVNVCDKAVVYETAKKVEEVGRALESRIFSLLCFSVGGVSTKNIYIY